MAFPTSPTVGQIYNDYRWNGGGWEYIALNYGISSEAPAANANFIKSAYPSIEDGSYWIGINNSNERIYCNMTISGGGWMSFASAPSSGGWFGGDTGAGASWENLTYNYGTYDVDGNIGNYWRNYSYQNVSELLFLTGNGLYWISFPISYVVGNTSQQIHTTNVYTSGNFPVDSNNLNDSINIYHRLENAGEDPWIQAGNTHGSGYDQGSAYMFWGENGHTTHADFKNNNGGIIAFIR